jgi:hypothetical protein
MTSFSQAPFWPLWQNGADLFYLHFYIFLIYNYKMTNPSEEFNNFIASQGKKKETKLPSRTHEEREIMKKYSIGNFGVATDYKNQFDIVQWCKAFLGEKGFGHLIVKEDGDTKETIRNYIHKEMQRFLSYDEYILREYRKNKEKLELEIYSKFLTEDGEKIVKRLNEIGIEIKRIIKQSPSEMDIKELTKLLDEGCNLILSQGIGY